MAEHTRLKELATTVERLVESNTQLQNTNQNPLQVRHVKLDFPRFDGSDPLNWLFRAEQFFTYYETPDAQRLTIASVHFEGSVIPWFQMLHKANEIPTWDALASAIEEHFVTVMANRVEGLSPEALLDCFLSGLKDHICRDVIAQDPKSIIHAGTLSRLFDEKQTASYGSKSKFGSPSNLPKTSMVNPSTSTIYSSTPPMQSTVPLLSLNAYHGSNGFTWNHKCPNKQMLLLMTSTDEPDLSSSIEESGAQPDVTCLPQETTEPHLSLNAYHGSNGVTTIRLSGPINGDKSLSPSQAQFHHFKRLSATDAIAEAYTIHCFSMDTIPDATLQLPDTVPNDLVNVLHGFAYVFTVPTVLLLAHIQITNSHKRVCLQEHRLYAKLSKCVFGQQRIEYLGHIVTGAGVEMDTAKVTAVTNWPIPTSVSQLRAFLGLTGYYRRFIKQYASIANPLTTLLQKKNFKWSHEAQSAFKTLKHALLTALVLVLPDFSKPFIIETDASGQSIGAILSQNGNPIAFFSKKLSPKMQQASTYVRELYAITEAVAKFRHYLFGHYFIIRTDHHSLRHISDQTIQTLEQQALLPKLLGYNFRVRNIEL
ncbi:ty3-gypsy retrotransposon protein [Tanacetum coccineum]